MRQYLWLAGTVLAGLAVLSAATALEPPADDTLPAWADARVRDWQPKASERRIDEIGWAKDLRTARQLSQKHNRPLFLFTMDGRITIGRC